MSYPSRRDRFVDYHANWSDYVRVSVANPVCLTSIKLIHDCVTKKAEAHGMVRIAMKAEKQQDALFGELNTRLTAVGMCIFWKFVGTQLHGDGEHELRELDGTHLKFKSPQEVVRWLNSVAAVFGQPPVAPESLYKLNRTCEVLVTLPGKKRRWMNESEWLATAEIMALQNAAEDKIIAACQALREEGQGIRITLKPSLTAKAAKLIGGMYGGAFVFSQEARNALRAVGQESCEVKPLTITFEYREPITTGLRWIARVLAPWIENLELVTAE